jgi:SHS2 domain-containing protein
MGRYRILEEIALADCALEIEGGDLGDLFETAAAALAQLMVDPATLDLSVSRRVALRADALDLLLYDWLSELIFLKDRDRQVFPRASVRVGGRDSCELEADLIGGTIDRDRTALRADLKAVTLHQFAVERAGEGWRARVVIDI